uniref:Protein kinase domain-containing protein n=1 Tax=Helianthus annuus TaxID=4232 RepID=A0A251VM70_HELAN
MECSLYDRIINQTKPFSESEIRNMCFQIFQGGAHIHHQGYVHRDLKPSNLLVFQECDKDR